MKKIILMMIIALMSMVSIASEKQSIIKYEKTYSEEIGDTIVKPIKQDNHTPYISKSLECDRYSTDDVSNYYLCVDLYYLGDIITDDVQIYLSNNKIYNIQGIKINNIKGKYYSVVIPINNEIINEIQNNNITKLNIGNKNEKYITEEDNQYLKENLRSYHIHNKNY